MKDKFLIITMMMMAAFEGRAQVTYNSTVDEIWGGRVFQELDGKYAGTSRSDTYTTWPSDERTVMVYCLRVPAGHVRADAVFTPYSGKKVTFNLRVIRARTGEIITSHTSTLTSTTATEQTLEIMPDVTFPSDEWYRFEITSPSGKAAISRFTKLKFQRKSSLAVGDSPIFMAPSVHLNTFSTTDANAPAGESYDWMYQEVMLPPQYEHPNTYVMAIGTDAGYSGIQSTMDGKGGYYHHVIFSVWDNGDTDKDPAMPDYLKSGALDKGEDVYITRFGGEGTGTSARKPSGYWWTAGKWVQVLWNARPENMEVTLTAKDGSDSIAYYQNTLESCWYKQEDETQWHYFATLRESGRNHYYSAFYSFLENFTDAGGELVRRAYYRNAAMRSVASGKWYARNSVTFGHTQGDGSRFSRKDYGHGQTALYDNCFYLEQGGFGETRDSAKILPLPAATPWVDTINVAALTARADEAIRRDEADQVMQRIENCSKVDTKGWTLMRFSSEETSGEGETGRAADALDGSNTTYWHSQWKGTKAGYPHYLVYDAGKETTMNGISLYQERGTNYRCKTIRISVSDDGNTWRTKKGGVLADESNPVLNFGMDITSRYFKIDFVSGYGSMLAINEITFLCDYDLDRLKNIARLYIEGADRLGGYPKQTLRTLMAVYDDGACTDTLALRQALEDMAQVQSLKYGMTKKIQNISTTRAYQLHNITKKAVLYADRELSAARLVPDGEENALDSCANWLILRSESYGKYFIYNMATRRYLTVMNGQLTEMPSVQSIAITAVTDGFRIGGLGDVYQILDNYAMAPDPDFAYAQLAACEFAPRLDEELTSLCEEALVAYGETFEYNVAKGDQTKSSARWSSNVNLSNGSHPISHLFDGNLATYYETWYSGITWPEEKSYIQLRLLSQLPAIRFTYVPSQNADYGLSDMPVDITLFASTDNKTWDRIATLNEGFPERISETYTSPIIAFGKKYAYVRFSVNRTHGNRGGSNKIFALAEMSVFGAQPNATASLYHTDESVRSAVDYMMTVLTDVRQKISNGTTTMDDYLTLQDAIDAVRRAKRDAETAVIPVSANQHVHWSTTPGLLRLSADTPTACALFAMDGSLLFSETIAGTVTVPVHQGYYILKIGGQSRVVRM